MDVSYNMVVRKCKLIIALPNFNLMDGATIKRGGPKFTQF